MIVLVHGGGPDINSTLEAMHIESKFSNGLRVTDKETMNVVQMVLAGKVNKGLVADLIGFGGRAIGLCGVDGELIQKVFIINGEIPHAILIELLTDEGLGTMFVK